MLATYLQVPVSQQWVVLSTYCKETLVEYWFSATFSQNPGSICNVAITPMVIRDLGSMFRQQAMVVYLS